MTVPPWIRDALPPGQAAILAGLDRLDPDRRSAYGPHLDAYIATLREAYRSADTSDDRLIGMRYSLDGEGLDGTRLVEDVEFARDEFHTIPARLSEIRRKFAAVWKQSIVGVCRPEIIRFSDPAPFVIE